MDKVYVMYVIYVLFVVYVLYVKLLGGYDGTTSWYQCRTNDKVSKLFHNVLVNNSVARAPFYSSNWDIILPCNNDYSNKSYLDIVNTSSMTKTNQIIGYVYNNSMLGSKEMIWRNLVKKYGREHSSTVMPKSYIFPEDLTIFNSEYGSHKHYILKTEQQRQRGLKLSNNYNEIINSNKKKYKIVQEYIDNAMTYNRHKLNFRIYLLLVCDKNGKTGYLYDDGIISYSKSASTKHGVMGINFDNAISSFYTSEKLYDMGYPILFSELKKKVSANWTHIQYQFVDLIRLVLNSTKDTVCHGSHQRSFQLFGIDYLIKNGKPYILEINIGPGMKPYNDIDKKMRINMHNDMLSIIGLRDKENKNFVKVWTS